MYRGHYSLESLLLPRLLERERVCVCGWMGEKWADKGWQSSCIVHTYIHTIRYCSPGRSVYLIAVLIKVWTWAQACLTQELRWSGKRSVWKVKVWKSGRLWWSRSPTIMQSWPSIIAESVHCSLHAPLEFMRRRRRVWRSWRTMRGICTSQHAMVGQFAWRKIANLSNRRHQWAKSAASMHPSRTTRSTTTTTTTTTTITATLYTTAARQASPDTTYSIRHTTAFRGVSLSDSTRFPRDRRWRRQVA